MRFGLRGFRLEGLRVQDLGQVAVCISEFARM